MVLFILNDASSEQWDGLYEPPPVTFTFEAIGWSVLAGIALMLVLLVIILGISKYIKNHYRREAIAKVQNTKSNSFEILVILKQVAILKYGRGKVANLSGEAWIEFLNHTAQGVNFKPHQLSIEELLYNQGNLDIEVHQQIEIETIKWLKTHA